LGQRKKIPLSAIVRLEELNPRDSSASGSKSKEHALVSLLGEQRKSITSEADRRIRVPAQGPSLSGSDMTLVVCKPPKDFPYSYKDGLTDESRVLVDGYQRYEAISDAGGLEVRVSIDEIEVESMAHLMREALELNYRKPVPLSAKEKLSHVFRLLLLGEFDDRFPWRPQFNDIASTTTLSEYKRLATFARKEAGLEGLPYDKLKDTLSTRIEETFDGLLTPVYDSKGFPRKVTVSAWSQIIETGDVTKWVDQKAKAKEEEERETALYQQRKAEAAKGISAEVRAKVDRQDAAILRKEFEDAEPDEGDFEVLFGDKLKDFDN